MIQVQEDPSQDMVWCVVAVVHFGTGMCGRGQAEEMVVTSEKPEERDEKVGGPGTVALGRDQSPKQHVKNGLPELSPACHHREELVPQRVRAWLVEQGRRNRDQAADPVALGLGPAREGLSRVLLHAEADPLCGPHGGELRDNKALSLQNPSDLGSICVRGLEHRPVLEEVVGEIGPLSWELVGAWWWEIN